MECFDAQKWSQQMNAEYNSLLENQTAEVVKRPGDQNIISWRWIYKQKKEQLSYGRFMPSYKAKLVARGFSQV